MDELDIFRSFRRGAAAPSPEARKRASAVLAAAIGAGVAHPSRLQQTTRRRRRGVVLIAAIAVVGTASALAAAREFFSVDPWTARGKVSRTVDGVRFSFTVPTHKQPYYKPDFGWMNGPAEKVGDKVRVRNLLISTGFMGGQAAEAVVFWTAYPTGGEAPPCSSLRSPTIGRSTVDLAAAMARAPGTTLIRRPTQTRVGGRPATHVVLRVREDRGCDPGYFFTWRDEWWGDFWPGTGVGDTIRVWIVDVGGKRLVIQSESRYPGPPGSAGDLVRAYRAEFKKVDQDITEIVASIRFD